MNMDKDTLARLIEAAQATLKDERHFSVVGSEDRAENGANLAADLLDALGIDTEPCAPGRWKTARNIGSWGPSGDFQGLAKPLGASI